VSARSFRRERAREIRREVRRRRLRARKTVAAGALLGATALIGPAGAQAATFTVDNTSDTTTAGACDPTIADDCSLRQAVEAANATTGVPDIVAFSGLSGNVITLTEGQINVTDDLDIQGPGAEALTISGDANSNGLNDINREGAGGDSRVFAFGTEMAGVNAAVSDLTLSGGTSATYEKYIPFPPPNGKYIEASSPGGAIVAINSTVTISDSTLTDNLASGDGGAVAAYAIGPPMSSLEIVNSDVSGNVAYGGGGALEVSNSGLTVTGSDVTGNQTLGKDFKYNANSGAGGGILGGIVTGAEITGSTIADNDATDAQNTSTPSPLNAPGGGIYLRTNGTSEFQISDTTISGNDGIGKAGGIYLYGEDATVDSSTISNNTVTDGGGTSPAVGGGIASEANLTLTRSTLSGNQATAATTDNGRGGGIYWRTPGSEEGLTVDRSTISGNQSSGPGGGAIIFTYASYSAGPPPTTTVGGPVSFLSSTVASNTGSAGGGIYEYANAPADHPPNPETLSSTIVGGNAPDDLGVSSYSGGFQSGSSLIQSDVLGIPFTESPAGSNVFGLDPQLGPLQGNGGPTETRLPATGSPVIDAGVANSLGVDQRGAGFPRTVDQPGVANGSGSDGTDIGAVELPLVAAPPSGGAPAPAPPAKRKKCKKKKKKKKSSAESAKKKKCKKKKKRK
jgi:hypothetical protein